MKKFLVIFLMLFGMSNVSALEYSDYSEFGEYTDEYIQSDDLTDVRMERRYKYYKFEKELGGYGEDDLLNYPYIDKEDYIYSDYSEPSIDMPEEKEGRVIEEISGYRYKKLKDINYLKLDVIRSPLVLSDVEILYNGEEVNYEIESEGVTEDVDNCLNIEPLGYIKFNFNEPIDMRYLTLSISIKSGDEWSTNYGISSGYDEMQYSFQNKYYEGETNYFFKGNEANVYTLDSIFEDFYSVEELDTSRILKADGQVNLYTYRDILYRNYNLNKVYSDEYLTGAYEDFIYKDEFLYKDYYSKRVRSVIPDPVIVEEANEKKDEVVYDVSNDVKSNTITDKTESTYQIPEKSLYYPLDINKIEDLEKVKTPALSYVYIPFILILVVLILVLSKLYQKKGKRVKV